MKVKKEYVPQTQRTDKEVEEKAYGKTSKPQTKQTDKELTDKAYGKFKGPQTQLSRDEMNKLAYGSKGGPQTQMSRDQMDKVAYGTAGRPQTQLSQGEMDRVAYGESGLPQSQAPDPTKMYVLSKFIDALSKGGDHWKLDYYNITGKSADAEGITKEQALIIIKNFMEGSGQLNPINTKNTPTYSDGGKLPKLPKLKKPGGGGGARRDTSKKTVIPSMKTLKSKHKVNKQKNFQKKLKQSKSGTIDLPGNIKALKNAANRNPIAGPIKNIAGVFKKKKKA